MVGVEGTVADLPRLENRNVEHFPPSFKRSRVVINHDRPRFWSEFRHITGIIGQNRPRPTSSIAKWESLPFSSISSSKSQF